MLSSIRHAGVPLLALLLSSSVSAQTVFVAELNGAQETPSNNSPGTGTGRILLDNATSMITIEVSVSGLIAPISAAHIHTGALGVSGGVTIPLSGTGPTWSQTSGPLTPAQRANLLANQWYFNVHSTAFPGGEVRGQITPADRGFDAYGTGTKEVPSNASPGIAIGEFTLNAANRLQYDVSATGLLASITAAHIHEGAPGVSGGVIFPLTSTGGGSFSGTTAPLTDLQRAKLRAGLYYVNVHSMMFPGGEVRGQLTPSFTSYGSGCAGSTGTPALDGSGTPVPGGSFSLDVSGGLPGGGGVLMFGLGAAETPLGGCTLNITTVPVVISVPLTLGAAGEASLPLTLPASGPTAWLQLQFAGLDLAAPGRVFALSNGLGLNIND